MTNYNVDIPDHETDVARILPPSPFYNLLPSPSDLAVPAYQNAILATVQKIRLIMQSVPIVKYWHCVHHASFDQSACSQTEGQELGQKKIYISPLS